MKIEDIGELKIKTHARALIVSYKDNVAMLLGDVKAGDVISLVGINPTGQFVAVQNIPTGQQIAITHIETGKPLVKSGQVLGFASRPIEPGHLVQSHNVELA